MTRIIEMKTMNTSWIRAVRVKTPPRGSMSSLTYPGGGEKLKSYLDKSLRRIG